MQIKQNYGVKYQVKIPCSLVSLRADSANQHSNELWNHTDEVHLFKTFIQNYIQLRGNTITVFFAYTLHTELTSRYGSITWPRQRWLPGLERTNLLLKRDQPTLPVRHHSLGVEVDLSIENIKPTELPLVLHVNNATIQSNRLALLGITIMKVNIDKTNQSLYCAYSLSYWQAL